MDGLVVILIILCVCTKIGSYGVRVANGVTSGRVALMVMCAVVLWTRYSLLIKLLDSVAGHYSSLNAMSQFLS